MDPLGLANLVWLRRCHQRFSRYSTVFPVQTWSPVGWERVRSRWMFVISLCQDMEMLFLHYWPFVRGIQQLLVGSPHEGPLQRTFGDWWERVSSLKFSWHYWIVHSVLGPPLLTIISAWISNHMLIQVWDKISYPFLKLHHWCLGNDT